MRLTKLRSLLYWLAKLLGDYRAIKTGRVARRVGYRLTGKVTGRTLWRIWQ